MFLSQDNCKAQNIDFDKYPHVILSNKDVSMKVYLPDPEKGFYRATRYDWTTAIGSLQYKGHEYFKFESETYDPTATHRMVGPASTFKKPGLGYDEAKVGDEFIRIGVGFIKKIEEPVYDYHTHYKLSRPGEWSTEQGKDWISFKHIINSDFGYGYVYEKTIRLKDDGFTMESKLQNTGEKLIETDQYNHNFFEIDGKRCNPSIQISYPFPITTDSDLDGKVVLKDNTIHFTRELEPGQVFMSLKGFGKKSQDNQFTIEDTDSGAGVTVRVDQPLTKMEFYSNGKMICPEHNMRIYVKPGEEQMWTSSYSFFVK
ncbi:MAG: hypothetical protein CMH46_15900 [Muricauda sp.]|nr:hypothetical protein [Allomuricauda sp.]|tara:strand:+ start:1109 stop:2050 length:942 start_codon:yes stop_codon:yes gene_type:complete